MFGRFQDTYLKTVQYLLPSPFTIAVLLTVVTYMLALLLTGPGGSTPYAITVLGYWQTGFWELLGFTMQMALILILGHALALAPVIDRLIDRVTVFCTSTARSAMIISFFAILVSFINWGLCLVFGAIFARKVAEKALKKGANINYPVIGAAGYSGMMAWHGGFSASAPLKVAEENHFLTDKIGQVDIADTLLSPLNMTVSASLLILVPLAYYMLGSAAKPQPIEISDVHKDAPVKDAIAGAERLDHLRIMGLMLGGIMVFIAIYKAIIDLPGEGFNFINLNYINFVLFGSCLILHQSFSAFLNAIQEAIGGAAGILIQFPLYAGIMGIMKYSGLVVMLSEVFVNISNSTTFPIFAFISAGLVNTFVPSGGGQWAVQGPILCDAALALKVPISKTVMALAYGDEVTNMLQPFWALPLLGITQLKARDILPYSTIIMVLGSVIFVSCLLIF